MRELMKPTLITGVAALLSVPAVHAQGVPAPAAAASAPAAASSAETFAPVMVTASKRKQLTTDVPYAVTAIGAGEIRDRGVMDLSEMQSVVPSLFITTTTYGQSRIQLRGMSTIAGSPTVGQYLDEMSIDMDQVQRALDVPLVDMARVEVLRGPQGTLYGTGSLGGTIRFITRDPILDRNEFIGESGMRSVKKGEVGWYANAIGNVVLQPGTAGIRIVAGYEKLPGWVDNSVNGDKDINGGSRNFIRAKGLLRVNDAVSVSLLGYHYSLGQDNPTFSNPDYTLPVYISSPNKDRFDLGNLVVNADLGAGTLVSSTGYIDRRVLQAADLSVLFSQFLPPEVLPVGSGIGLRDDMKYKIFTQELRLASNSTGPLSWLVGGYYRDSKTSHERTTPVTSAPAPITFLDSQGTNPVDSKQYAAFGEIGYAVNRDVVLTGGLRYFYEKQRLTETLPPREDSANFHALSPRLNVLWRYSPQQSAYVNVAKGFRSGGFNTEPPPSYGPESLWTYEAGGKGSLAGGKLQYDVAIYYSKYDNVQGLDVPPGGLFATTTNTGKASGPGIDFAVVAEIAPGLTADVALGYVDIKYDVTTADRNKGDPLNYIPKWTAAVGATYRYTWPGISMPGIVRIDYQHTDKTQLIARSAGVAVSTEAANYWNMRVGVEQPTWQVYLEGRNLTNFYGVTNPAVGAITTPTRPQPRSIGLTARVQF